MTLKALGLLLLCGSCAPALAAEACSTEVEGTDTMTYNVSAIQVPATCKQFTVTLSHPGEMPKSVMGHNWVLAKPDDVDGIANDGAQAGEAQDYVKPGDSRVIAATHLVGAGEHSSVTFDTARLKAGTPYTFFCSYPAHDAVMKGTLTLGG